MVDLGAVGAMSGGQGLASMGRMLYQAEMDARAAFEEAFSCYVQETQGECRDPAFVGKMLHGAGLHPLVDAFQLPHDLDARPRDPHGYFSGLLDPDADPDYWPAPEYDPCNLDPRNCAPLSPRAYPTLQQSRELLRKEAATTAAPQMESSPALRWPPPDFGPLAAECDGAWAAESPPESLRWSTHAQAGSAPLVDANGRPCLVANGPDFHESSPGHWQYRSSAPASPLHDRQDQAFDGTFLCEGSSMRHRQHSTAPASPGSGPPHQASGEMTTAASSPQQQPQQQHHSRPPASHPCGLPYQASNGICLTELFSEARRQHSNAQAAVDPAASSVQAETLNLMEGTRFSEPCRPGSYDSQVPMQHDNSSRDATSEPGLNPFTVAHAVKGQQTSSGDPQKASMHSLPNGNLHHPWLQQRFAAFARSPVPLQTSPGQYHEPGRYPEYAPAHVLRVQPWSDPNSSGTLEVSPRSSSGGPALLQTSPGQYHEPGRYPEYAPAHVLSVQPWSSHDSSGTLEVSPRINIGGPALPHIWDGASNGRHHSGTVPTVLALQAMSRSASTSDLEDFPRSVREPASLRAWDGRSTCEESPRSSVDGIPGTGSWINEGSVLGLRPHAQGLHGASHPPRPFEAGHLYSNTLVAAPMHSTGRPHQYRSSVEHSKAFLRAAAQAHQQQPSTDPKMAFLEATAKLLADSGLQQPRPPQPQQQMQQHVVPEIQASQLLPALCQEQRQRTDSPRLSQGARMPIPADELEPGSPRPATGRVSEAGPARMMSPVADGTPALETAAVSDAKTSIPLARKAHADSHMNGCTSAAEVPAPQEELQNQGMFYQQDLAQAGLPVHGQPGQEPSLDQTAERNSAKGRAARHKRPQAASEPDSCTSVAAQPNPAAPAGDLTVEHPSSEGLKPHPVGFTPAQSMPVVTARDAASKVKRTAAGETGSAKSRQAPLSQQDGRPEGGQGAEELLVNAHPSPAMKQAAAASRSNGGDPSAKSQGHNPRRRGRSTLASLPNGHASPHEHIPADGQTKDAADGCLGIPATGKHLSNPLGQKTAGQVSISAAPRGAQSGPELPLGVGARDRQRRGRGSANRDAAAAAAAGARKRLQPQVSTPEASLCSGWSEADTAAEPCSGAIRPRTVDAALLTNLQQANLPNAASEAAHTKSAISAEGPAAALPQTAPERSASGSLSTAPPLQESADLHVEGPQHGHGDSDAKAEEAADVPGAVSDCCSNLSEATVLAECAPELVEDGSAMMQDPGNTEDGASSAANGDEAEDREAAAAAASISQPAGKVSKKQRQQAKVSAAAAASRQSQGSPFLLVKRSMPRPS